MTSADGARVLVVDRDGVGVRIAGDAVRDHVRSLRALDQFPAGKIVRAGDDDQTRRTPGEDRSQLGPLHRLFAVGTGDDDLVAVLSEALFDGRDDGGEKRIIEIGNKDGDDLGLSRAQHRGEGIGAIVESVDRGSDLLDELGADRLPAGQHVRNCGRRDARHPRHVIDRSRLFDHRLGPSLPVKRFTVNRFTAPEIQLQEKSRKHAKKYRPGRFSVSARRLELPL